MEIIPPNVYPETTDVLEIEVKYAVADHEPIRRAARERGASEALTRCDADTYLRAPDRDFAQTDEVFRLRRVGDENFLTYKGPKLDRETKTRKEIELPVGTGSELAGQLLELLSQLGYQPVATVKKTRQIFHLDRGGFHLEICFDEVEEVGKYVELEIIAPAEDLPAAKAVLLNLAAEFGLANPERLSYLGLLLARRAGGK